MSYKTEQEEFWATEFGNDYINRKRNQNINNIPFLSEVISKTSNVNSVIEFGCNIGLNLKALNILLPECELTGIDISQVVILVVTEDGTVQEFIKQKGDFLDSIHDSVAEWRKQNETDELGKPISN